MSLVYLEEPCQLESPTFRVTINPFATQPFISAFLVARKFPGFTLWRAWELRNTVGKKSSSHGFVIWEGGWPLCPIKLSPKYILPFWCNALQLAPWANAFNSRGSLRWELTLVAPWQRWNNSIMQQNIFEMLILATCNLILFFFLLPFFMTFHSPVVSIDGSAS